MNSSAWFQLLFLFLSTVVKTLGVFLDQSLKIFIPLVLILFLIAVLLFLISAIAPLAPFVYSLI